MAEPDGSQTLGCCPLFLHKPLRSLRDSWSLVQYPSQPSLRRRERELLLFTTAYQKPDLFSAYLRPFVKGSKDLLVDVFSVARTLGCSR